MPEYTAVTRTNFKNFTVVVKVANYVFKLFGLDNSIWWIWFNHNNLPVGGFEMMLVAIWGQALVGINSRPPTMPLK